jgi:hypothetical protein
MRNELFIRIDEKLSTVKILTIKPQSQKDSRYLKGLTTNIMINVKSRRAQII